jgi:hypothetical protein
LIQFILIFCFFIRRFVSWLTAAAAITQLATAPSAGLSTPAAVSSPGSRKQCSCVDRIMTVLYGDSIVCPMSLILD